MYVDVNSQQVGLSNVKNEINENFKFVNAFNEYCEFKSACGGIGYNTQIIIKSIDFGHLLNRGRFFKVCISFEIKFTNIEAYNNIMQDFLTNVVDEEESYLNAINHFFTAVENNKTF